jgi:hypothetical protein
MTLGRLQKEGLAIDELPFLKRQAFEHEGEYRMIYESTTGQKIKARYPHPVILY